MTISQRIFSILTEKKLKQKDLAEYVGISTSAISDWKKKNTNPSAENLSAIADFLNVSLRFLLTGEERIENIKLSDDIKELISYYNTLDERSKGKIIGKAEALAELAAERAAEKRAAEQPQKTTKIAVPAADEQPEPEDDEPEQDEEFYIDLCSLPASAGSGVQLDEGFTEPMLIKPTAIAERANYAVRVSGNSMEPEYYSGDIVLVETCPEVAIGEIGIFTVNDQGYIKQRGEDKLISLNPKSPDVDIHEGDVVYCRGRVLGKAEVIE